MRTTNLGVYSITYTKMEERVKHTLHAHIQTINRLVGSKEVGNAQTINRQLGSKEVGNAGGQDIGLPSVPLHKETQLLHYPFTHDSTMWRSHALQRDIALVFTTRQGKVMTYIF